MRLISFDLEDRMKSLGWYQIAGALIGFYLVIKFLAYEGTLTGGNLLAFIIAGCLCAYSFYCGNLLRKVNTRGLHLSMWNQAIQVLQIGFSVITFEYYSGIRLAFGFNWDEVFEPDFSFGLSAFYIRYGESISNLSIWINVVPLAIMYLINKVENEIEARKQSIESARKISEEYIQR